MKPLRHIFSVIFCFSLLSASAQTGSFEANTPATIPLDGEKLERLTSGFWRVFREDWNNKGTVRSFAKNISMCYYADGTFLYNGSTGTWKVLDDGSIDYKLDAKAESDLNFGGIFSVTKLSDSALTLTKVLTTSHDLKRTLHLRPSTVLTRTRQHDSGAPYFFEGTLSAAVVDSLCSMDADQLFNAGISLLPNNMIHIMTPDTLHVIRPKVPEKRHTRIPLH